MKTKILAFILTLSMMLAFTSCLAKPELDLNDAKKNLKSEDYNVKVEDDEDFLDVGVVEQLEAYSEDGDDYIYIVKYESAKYAKLVYDMMKQEYDYGIKSSSLQIKQIEFILDEYDKDLDSDEIDDYEDEIKDLNKNLKEAKEDYSFGISGDIIWFGTAQALEDSRR